MSYATIYDYFLLGLDAYAPHSQSGWPLASRFDGMGRVCVCVWFCVFVCEFRSVFDLQ